MSDSELRYRPPAADVAVARERPWPRLAWAVAALGALAAGWRLLGLIGFVGGFAMASPELRELYLEYAAPTATVSLAVVAALASAVVLLLRRRPLCLVAWTFALLAAAIQLALELGAVQSFPTSRLLWHLSALLPALLGLLHSLSLLRRGLLA